VVEFTKYMYVHDTYIQGMIGMYVYTRYIPKLPRNANLLTINPCAYHIAKKLLKVGSPSGIGDLSRYLQFC